MDEEDVYQKFIADVSDYVDNALRASASARDFADGAEEAKIAVDGMRDHAIEAGEALGHVRDEAIEAAEAEKKLGTAAEETAAKLDLMGLSGASTFTMLGPLLGVIGAIVVAAAAVAPAVASMGLAFGAFGLFALPTIMQVSSGLQQINQDMNAVQSATTAVARNKALAQLQHDWAGMPAPIAAAVKQLLAFKNEFESLAVKSGIQSSVLGDLAKGLQIARQVLPEIIPLAQAGAKAVSGMLTAIGQGLTSSGFRQFLQLMTNMAVPATQAIMRLAMVLTGTLGQALEALMGDSVPFINFLADLIRALSGPLVAALNFIINLFMGLASAIDPLLPGLSKIATLLISDVGASFEAFVPIVAQVIQILGGTLLKILTDLEPVLANMLTPNSPFMMALQQLPGLLRAIMPLFSGLAALFADPHIAQLTVLVLSLIVAFRGLLGVLALARDGFALLTEVMAVNPVILIAAAIAGLVVALIYLSDNCKAFRDFWKDAWRDIQHWAEVAFDWLKGHWPLIAAILIGPVAIAAYLIVTHWRQIVSGAERMWHDVVSFFTRLPGDILHALGDLGHLLWHAGQMVIQGLIDGLGSMVGNLLSAAQNIAGNLMNSIGHALGIGSRSRIAYQHALWVGQGLIDGLEAMRGPVAAAAAHLGLGGLGGAGIGAAGGGFSGAPSVHVTVPVTLQGTAQLYNSPAFYQYLQVVVQEAIARWGLSNPGTGLAIPGRA